jgi:hypothetical protein
MTSAKLKPRQHKRLIMFPFDVIDGRYENPIYRDIVYVFGFAVFAILSLVLMPISELIATLVCCGLALMAWVYDLKVAVDTWKTESNPELWYKHGGVGVGVVWCWLFLGWMFGLFLTFGYFWHHKKFEEYVKEKHKEEFRAEEEAKYGSDD